HHDGLHQRGRHCDGGNRLHRDERDAHLRAGGDEQVGGCKRARRQRLRAGRDGETGDCRPRQHVPGHRHDHQRRQPTRGERCADPEASLRPTTGGHPRGTAPAHAMIAYPPPTTPPDPTVSVHHATADETATPGTDYHAASGTLTFAPGETGKQILVTVYGDTTY